MKLPEHTWGLPSERNSANWSNAQFYPLRQKDANFINCSNAWVEQRQFVDYAVEALGNHSLATDVMNRLKKLVVAGPPDLSGYSVMNNLQNKIENCNGLDLQFDGNYGNIISFVDKNNREWASMESPFGIFEYVSYDETDFSYMCDIYTTGCYSKKGSQPFDIRNKWQTKMDKLYIKNISNTCSVVSHLTFPETAYTQIGAPYEAFVNITVNSTGLKFRQYLYFL